MKSAFIISISLLLVTLFLFAAAPEQTSSAAEAARLNNLGAAYMNQQSFEKALKAFQDAAARDPKLTAARLNQGIALLSLGRVDEAKEFLEEAVKRDPADPHAWYSLGLLYKNTSNAQAAVDAFRRVTEVDPNDADTWYFLGSAYSQTRQYPQAIDAFQRAIKLNPVHASAEFGLSRAYQQSGDVAHAREHLQRFQYITQNKLGSPIGLAYGEQGKYSLAEESPAAIERVSSAIPVRFVATTETAGLAAKPASRTSEDVSTFLGPGACFLDYDGDGKLDIFLADNGKEGGMALYHNRSNGSFEDVTRQAGLDPSFHAIGCTGGDYDNDGATDLAVTAANRILVLHNEKNG
jgi:tetratricopeptide (TPR) repeat protein